MLLWVHNLDFAGAEPGTVVGPLATGGWMLLNIGRAVALWLGVAELLRYFGRLLGA
jgi:hypothetical protein